MSPGLSRRAMLGAVLGAGALRASGTSAAGRPPVLAGAIRWDAWYDRSGSSAYAQDNLAPPAFHGRAPVHCTFPTPTTINCVGTQAVVDAEIERAAAAGLRFWAFVWYDDGSSLHRAWTLYRSSPVRAKIGWAPILTLAALGAAPYDPARVDAALARWVALMREEGFQTVGEGAARRPLVFLLWHAADLAAFDGDTTKVAAALARLATLSRAAGLEAPYVVLLDGLRGTGLCRTIGADAIGAYNAAFRAADRPLPYQALAAQTERSWAALADSGLPMVPTAMVGWDARPRRSHPEPWQPRQAALTPAEQNRYYALATPAELERHVGAAVRFVDTRPTACPSRVLLVYSWDECDEGGGLLPTIDDTQGARLDALAAGLRS